MIAKKSEYKPPVDILDVDENAFVYDIMRLYNLSGSLPFKNHVHLHSFNKEVQDKGVLDGLRDVLLAYAIPSIQSEVSSNVRITASALRALDEGDYNVIIFLLLWHLSYPPLVSNWFAKLTSILAHFSNTR